MKDREFLMWLHARLTEVHKEHECYDYMHKLRSIICSIPPQQDTPAMSGFCMNSLNDLKKWLETGEVK